MHYDIAIIGAGPAGLSLARRLKDSGLSIAMIDKNTRDCLSSPPADGRDIALTHLSVKLLKQLDAWKRIPQSDVCPIREAQVIEGDSPYTLSFDCKDSPHDALGYLVSNYLIRRAIFESAMENPDVELSEKRKVTAICADKDHMILETSEGRGLTASLVVGADTRFSETRGQAGIASDMHQFGRIAIVCNMEHEFSHEQTALECFHYGYTLAVLPMQGNTSSIVITIAADKAGEWLQLPPSEYSARVQERLNNKLGHMKLITERFSYPLTAVHATRFYSGRYVLLGDAAVGMHPVTAHGFNLGLSGADILGEEIMAALQRGETVSSQTALQRYQRRHMIVTRPLFSGTNHIVNLFTNESTPAKLARKAALRLSNHLPPVKWAIRQKLTAEKHGLGVLMPFGGNSLF